MLHEIVLAPQAQTAQAQLKSTIPGLPMTTGDDAKAAQPDKPEEKITIELEGKQVAPEPVDPDVEAAEAITQSKNSNPTNTTAANTASVMGTSLQGGGIPSGTSGPDGSLP